jgi:predicted N-acetyltransferase YhbS
MVAKRSEAAWTIEPLGKEHDRAAFSCGNGSLGSYLKTQASQDARRHAAAPFVALVSGGGRAVVGYYALSAFGIELREVSEAQAKKLPRYPLVPATLQGRLAVDTSQQRKGVGEYLLMDALYRAHAQSAQIASAAIVVGATDDRAGGFYRHFEFIPFPERRDRLFLPMQTSTSRPLPRSPMALIASVRTCELRLSIFARQSKQGR